MSKMRVIVAGLFALFAVLTMLLSAFAEPTRGEMAFVKWFALTIIALAAIATIREHFSERAERRREREQETRIQVLDGGDQR